MSQLTLWVYSHVVSNTNNPVPNHTSYIKALIPNYKQEEKKDCGQLENKNSKRKSQGISVCRDINVTKQVILRHHSYFTIGYCSPEAFESENAAWHESITESL